MTIYGSESVAVQAFRLGIRDYIRKPLRVPEILAAIERALAEDRLRREKEQYRRAARTKPTNRLEQQLARTDDAAGHRPIGHVYPGPGQSAESRGRSRLLL